MTTICRDTLTKQLEKATDPLEEFRLKLLLRGARYIKGLGKAFNIIDDAGSRSLGPDEFQEAVGDFGLDLNAKETDALFKRFDKDSSGSINFEEFLLALKPPMNDARKDVVLQAFKKMDKTGDGVITIADLDKVYPVKEDKETVHKEFLNSFEPGEKDGKVTQAEFIQYYSALSASIDNDELFSLTIRNAFKI